MHVSSSSRVRNAQPLSGALVNQGSHDQDRQLGNKTLPEVTPVHCWEHMLPDSQTTARQISPGDQMQRQGLGVEEQSMPVHFPQAELCAEGSESCADLWQLFLY